MVETIYQGIDATISMNGGDGTHLEAIGAALACIGTPPRFIPTEIGAALLYRHACSIHPHRWRRKPADDPTCY
jgi:hypothetical protein